GLLEIKLEVLCQLAPAVMLGVHWKGLRGGPVLWGMVVGTVAAVGIRYGWDTAPLGVHAGLWGLGANGLVVVVFGKLKC
ncbi:MAG: hypothetical protein P8J87_09930, partial [Verrucomicrobiales bacterium]|nr:hypothetical protein [Verrucomicrobiales bacterium]